jgi:uncharacterized protein YndB with AHSA1/START domain
MEIPLPDGKYVGQGTFREVQPPEKLVFTWSWKHVPEKQGEHLGGESLVTVELFDLRTSRPPRSAKVLGPAGRAASMYSRACWPGCSKDRSHD